jgi:hypothetical protein
VLRIICIKSYWDQFSHRYPSSHFSCLSPSPPPTPFTLFWFFIILIYSFVFLIFTVGLFVIYLSSFIPIFSSVTLTLFHIVFLAVLAVCILGTPSSFTLFVSTPFSPWFYPIGCHHITRFATPPYFPESTL